jgi:hypothetical protein
MSYFTLVLSINTETQYAISCILAHQVTKALSSFAVKAVGGPNCLIVTFFILQLRIVDLKMLKCFPASLCIIWPLWMLCKAKVMVSFVHFPCAFLKVVVEGASGMTRLTFSPTRSNHQNPFPFSLPLFKHTNKQFNQANKICATKNY